MNSTSILSNLKALRGGYAPRKARDALEQLFTISLVATVSLLAVGIALAPYAVLCAVTIALTLYLAVKVTQSTYTIISYLIKGE